MESCIEDILRGVEEVAPIGMPGRIIVFGEGAEAVLTGKSEEDTIIAAAELGKGRILAFSHAGYAKQMADETGNFANSTLYRNARNWVTKKNKNTGYKILNLDTSQPVKTLKELQTFDILLTIGGREPTGKGLVKQYIEGGGGLVMGATPWGWLQCNINKPLHDMPYCSILVKAGLSFSKEIANDHGAKFVPSMSKATTANVSRIHGNVKEMHSLLDKVSFMKLINELPRHCANAAGEHALKYLKDVETEIGKCSPRGQIKTANMREKALLEFWTMCAKYQNSPHIKAPFIEDFPGDFNVPPPMTNKSVNFISKQVEVYVTGCYVAAGSPASIKVTAIKNHWKVLVGAHVDYLDGHKVNRWPDITKSIDVGTTGEFSLSSPFGGGVYLLSSNLENSTIEATLCNVVIQPLYDSQDEKSRRSWVASKSSPGLWADLMGKYIIFTFPSKSIRNLKDPSKVLDLYDQLLEAYHDLIGTRIEDQRKMWVVADKQPKAGYMHAGYPIVTHLDVTNICDKNFLLDAGNFKGGYFWGLFHEIGHNLQNGMWTFEGTSEVTVNLFTLYGMQVLCGIPSWIHPWLAKQFRAAIKYLRTGADFAKWKKEPGLALVIYAQLVNCFTWDAYKKVFRQYNTLPPYKKPRNNQDKMDLWIKTFSKTVGYNLQPLAMFWGYPLSAKCVKELQDLGMKPFLPIDEVTKEVPQRVELVKAKFPNLIQKLI